MTTYVELQVTSHFSFLRGASSPDELFAAAALQGHAALGIVDRGSVAGLVRAWEAQKATGVRMIAGARVDLDDGRALLLYPTDKPAWSRLTRLLTLGKARAGKGGCTLGWSDVVAWQEGLVAILLPGEADAVTAAQLAELSTTFGMRGYCGLAFRRRPDDALRLHDLAALAGEAGIRAVALGDILYHAPEARLLQDVVTAIREKCTVDTLGYRRERHADRHLKSPAEMERRFAAFPDAIAATAAIARACTFDLGELSYQYPHERVVEGLTAQGALEQLTETAAARMFPDGPPQAYLDQIAHELKLIGELGYAPYFLTVNSIVAESRRRGILCQGRGSAANSCVCFVLGITSIDPIKHELLFERFVSGERREPPDIDVDFEHERREEIIQWIYDTYGRNHAALTAVVTRYRARGAVREVGKALGLPEDLTKALAGLVWGWSQEGVGEKQVAQLNLNMNDRRLRLALELSRQLIGVPRHLSQHPGGFVLTHDRLDDLVPIEPAAMVDRQVIEWDKDDIDALKFMKVDVLGLGMLGCMNRAFNLLEEAKGLRVGMADLQDDDPDVYAMIQKADTLGTFQIESRAQMSMLPRMKPARFYDLVIEVAIVRPGPIQGDMVHPISAAARGARNPTIRARTEGRAGEDARRAAVPGTGDEGGDRGRRVHRGEADQLRRAMATFKFTGGVSQFYDKLVEGMVPARLSPRLRRADVQADRGLRLLRFPGEPRRQLRQDRLCQLLDEACHHPDVFCAALLNAQPMGFYAPAQIVRDAREHGVEVRPVCVNASRWDCTLEPTRGRWLAVRLGLRQVRGLANAHGERSSRRAGSRRSIRWRKCGGARAYPAPPSSGSPRPMSFHTLGEDRRQGAVEA
jgi:error-prone DNA polymerase